MNKTIRNIIIVAFIAVGSGWLGVWLNNVMGQPQSLESLGALIWLVTPALAGILLRAFGGDGWKDAGFGLYLRSGWKWYLVAILVYPLIALLTFGLAAAVGAISTEGFAVQGFGAYISAAGIAIVGSLMKNIFEEFAWRGYLTPKLEAAKVPPLLNHLIVGVVWWAWHLPYYYFLFDRALLDQYLSVNLNTFIVIAIFVLFPTAILFGELRLLSKSVWPVFILHNLINGLSLTLILDGFIELNGLAGTTLSPTNDGIVVSTLFGVVGLFLYRYRISRAEPVPTKENLRVET
jgi:membrane protease YdiL (CAAX protease family)